MELKDLYALFTIDKGGCWIWKGKADNKKGYGHIYDRSIGNQTYAHRFIYRQFKPRTDIKGKFLRHLCGNKNCVNPEHIEVETMSAHFKRVARDMGLGRKVQPRRPRAENFQRYILGELAGMSISLDDDSIVQLYAQWKGKRVKEYSKLQRKKIARQTLNTIVELYGRGCVRIVFDSIHDMHPVASVTGKGKKVRVA